MKSSFDFIAYTPSGKHGNQRNRYYCTDSQHNGRPSQPQCMIQGMIHKKLYHNTKCCGFHEKQTGQETQTSCDYEDAHEIGVDEQNHPDGEE